MKQRQTYPAVRGEARDEVGLLPLGEASSLTVWIEVPGVEGDLFELPAVALEPTQTFLRLGQEYQANFEAPIGASGLTADVAEELRGVLEVDWGDGNIQFVPKDGFMTFAVTENVKAPPS
jgi:hypothetical protein